MIRKFDEKLHCVGDNKIFCYSKDDEAELLSYEFSKTTYYVSEIIITIVFVVFVIIVNFIIKKTSLDINFIYWLISVLFLSKCLFRAFFNDYKKTTALSQAINTCKKRGVKKCDFISMIDASKYAKERVIPFKKEIIFIVTFCVSLILNLNIPVFLLSYILSKISFLDIILKPVQWFFIDNPGIQDYIWASKAIEKMKEIDK